MIDSTLLMPAGDVNILRSFAHVDFHLFTLIQRKNTGAEITVGRFEDENLARTTAEATAKQLPEGYTLHLLRTEHGKALKLIGVYAKPPQFD